MIIILIFFLGAKRPPNICLTCFSAPEGLGMICAPGAVGDSTNHAKGNVRLKQLLGISSKIISLNLNSREKHIICKFYYILIHFFFHYFHFFYFFHIFLLHYFLLYIPIQPHTLIEKLFIFIYRK